MIKSVIFFLAMGSIFSSFGQLDGDFEKEIHPEKVIIHFRKKKHGVICFGAKIPVIIAQLGGMWIWV